MSKSYKQFQFWLQMRCRKTIVLVDCTSFSYRQWPTEEIGVSLWLFSFSPFLSINSKLWVAARLFRNKLHVFVSPCRSVQLQWQNTHMLWLGEIWGYCYQILQVIDLLKLYNDSNVPTQRLLFKIPATWQVSNLKIELQCQLNPDVLMLYSCTGGLLTFYLGNRSCKVAGIWRHTNTFDLCLQVV